MLGTWLPRKDPKAPGASGKAQSCVGWWPSLKPRLEQGYTGALAGVSLPPPPSGKSGNTLVCGGTERATIAGCRAACAGSVPPLLSPCTVCNSVDGRCFSDQCRNTQQGAETPVGTPGKSSPLENGWPTTASQSPPSWAQAASYAPGRWGRSGCRRSGTPPGSSLLRSPARPHGWQRPSLKGRGETFSLGLGGRGWVSAQSQFLEHPCTRKRGVCLPRVRVVFHFRVQLVPAALPSPSSVSPGPAV